MLINKLNFVPEKCLSLSDLFPSGFTQYLSETVFQMLRWYGKFVVGKYKLLKNFVSTKSVPKGVLSSIYRNLCGAGNVKKPSQLESGKCFLSKCKSFSAEILY